MTTTMTMRGNLTDGTEHISPLTVPADAMIAATRATEDISRSRDSRGSLSSVAVYRQKGFGHLIATDGKVMSWESWVDEKPGDFGPVFLHDAHSVVNGRTRNVRIDPEGSRAYIDDKNVEMFGTLDVAFPDCFALVRRVLSDPKPTAQGARWDPDKMSRVASILRPRPPKEDQPVPMVFSTRASKAGAGWNPMVFRIAFGDRVRFVFAMPLVGSDSAPRAISEVTRIPE